MLYKTVPNVYSAIRIGLLDGIISRTGISNNRKNNCWAVMNVLRIKFSAKLNRRPESHAKEKNENTGMATMLRIVALSSANLKNLSIKASYSTGM